MAAEAGEREDVEYTLEISVPAGTEPPSAEQVQSAVYRDVPEIDSEDSVYVERVQ